MTIKKIELYENPCEDKLCPICKKKSVYKYEKTEEGAPELIAIKEYGLACVECDKMLVYFPHNDNSGYDEDAYLDTLFKNLYESIEESPEFDKYNEIIKDFLEYCDIELKNADDKIKESFRKSNKIEIDVGMDMDEWRTLDIEISSLLENNEITKKEFKEYKNFQTESEDDDE